ncbi:DUF3114 domain-containing protein [Ligilactobacillus salitolerans]|nr:DUF3114 domain-containing protein [Ligilactobacillus salitolerans]
MLRLKQDASLLGKMGPARRVALLSHLRFLRRSDHWDQAALAEYVSQTASSVSFEDLAAQFLTTQQVGSPLYARMYAASRLKPRQKLRLVLRHLGAQVDQSGFLQLIGTHQFAPTLAPHAEFLARFRADVQKVFSAGLLTDSLGLRLHLLRSWLDQQFIAYVRHYFAGETDYQKLLDYAQQAGLEMDYTTNAAFHNRVESAFSYPHHMKVQVPASNTMEIKGFNNARMSEFIVDLDTGAFVSEWNVYRKTAAGLIDSDPGRYSRQDQYQIANTESFNYGLPKGQRGDVKQKDHSHQVLDVKHPADPLVRQEATRRFHIPHSGQYVDLVKSAPDLAAWQKVSAKKRQAKYEDYRAWCYEQGMVAGFGQKP